MTNTATNELPVSTQLPKWQIFYAAFFALAIPLSWYQRDWQMLCFAVSQVLISFARKEPQMSFPVKMTWGVAAFGFLAASFILLFKNLLSHKL